MYGLRLGWRDGASVVVAEEAAGGERDGLYPVANTELREETSHLSLDGVLADVKVRGELRLVIPVGSMASSSLSRSVSPASRPGQRSSSGIAARCERWVSMTVSPRLTARMPSTIWIAGTAFEMNPRAPASKRARTAATWSEKLNTMMAPFVGSATSSRTRPKRSSSPYVSRSVMSTARQQTLGHQAQSGPPAKLEQAERLHVNLESLKQQARSHPAAEAGSLQQMEANRARSCQAAQRTRRGSDGIGSCSRNRRAAAVKLTIDGASVAASSRHAIRRRAEIAIPGWGPVGTDAATRAGNRCDKPSLRTSNARSSPIWRVWHRGERMRSAARSTARAGRGSKRYATGTETHQTRTRPRRTRWT